MLAYDEGHRRTSGLFLRLLALIYLAAFVSAALEITGLVGEAGILPADAHLAGLEQRFGAIAWIRFPTLFWLDASDVSLLAASWLGCLFAVLLLTGRWPTLAALALFLLYLSVYRAGQLFFNFQWDYLLLEAGFLAIFLTVGPNRLLVFLFHWLLFRLRFLSGLSKVLSGDPSWADLTALRYYFETQPLPHIGAWYAHQLPEWLLKTGAGFTLFVELIVPLFIFLPRPFRLFAAAATILIQLLIILTSNHNFINLLTIALCVFLLDDRALARLLPGRLFALLAGPGPAGCRGPAGRTVLTAAAALLLATSVVEAYGFVVERREPTAWNAPTEWVRGWGLGNVYHVFPTMQTERQELIIEGSHDGSDWRAYRFRYKPNDPRDRPAFIVPLHPRLDWMIWFVPTQNPAMRPWFEAFLWRLAANAPTVTALLRDNPFPDAGPRYLRVQAYRYRFTTPAERLRSGRVWHAEYLGEFPAVPPRNP